MQPTSNTTIHRQAQTQPPLQPQAQKQVQEYHMVTAKVEGENLYFPSDKAFHEAMSVGFFRVKTPESMDLDAGRLFARTFTSNPRYNQFGRALLHNLNH